MNEHNRCDTVTIERSLLEAAIAEIRAWKVQKGGDDQVALNLEAAIASADSEPNPSHYRKLDEPPAVTKEPQPDTHGGTGEKWWPIKTAPKDGRRILLHPAIEVGDSCSKGHWSGYWHTWIVDGSPSGVAHTHWMPLPAPPAITKEPIP